MATPLDELMKKVKEKKEIEAKQKETPKDELRKLVEESKKNEKQIYQEMPKKTVREEIREVMNTPSETENYKRNRAEKILDPKKLLEKVKREEEQEKQIEKEDNLFREKTDEKSIIEKKMDEEEKKEIDSYGNTKIYHLKKSGLKYYFTPVPRPNAAEKAIINTLKEAATRIITVSPYKIRDPEARRNVYYQKIMEMLKDNPQLRIPSNKFDFYADAIVREMVGYGLIDELIKDDKLEEIMVIGPQKPVYVFHRKYEMMLTNIEFYSDKEIIDLINRVAREIGRRVDISNPLLDARLMDGSRVNATIPPASVSGASLTIRKFRSDPYSIIDLIKIGTINAETAAYLWLFVEGLKTKPANILIAGGTGSGKTTTLNVLTSFVPESERVITIEDTAELNLPLKHWIRMEARAPGLEGTGEITMDILTKNSLRMRPDRIVVGEIRHSEAFSLFTAMNTGHDGCLGTVHANSAQETIVRVTNPPMNVPEIMMSGLNFVLVQNRIHDRKKGTIRRITEIAEVTGALEGQTKTQTIFEWDATTDKLIKTEIGVNYIKELEKYTGMNRKQIENEVLER
ncbi:MAG: CpaF family protein, partial [Candidatus Diapherotrites archaeon]|nr:CpaF family protein [Candidatus Diapherotrites archaeon]